MAHTALESTTADKNLCNLFDGDLESKFQHFKDYIKKDLWIFFYKQKLQVQYSRICGIK